MFVGIDLTYDQQCELSALMYALEHTTDRPKGAQAIKNMEKRHVEAKKTPKAILAAWRGPCEDRNMVIGTGVSARLKPEFWPQHIPVPAGYYQTEAQVAAASEIRVGNPGEQFLSKEPSACSVLGRFEMRVDARWRHQ